MKQKFRLLLVFSFLGIVIGFFVAANKIYKAQEGFYATWRELVYDEVFNTIVYANSNTIWAHDARENFLYRAVDCTDLPECHQWLKTKEIPTPISNAIEKRSSCSFHDYRFQEEPPANVVQCVRAKDSKIVYYVLLEDGTIWYWTNSYSSLRAYQLLLTSASLGLLSGIGVFILYLIIRLLARKSFNKEELT